MTDFFKQLIQRRVLVILGAYFAATVALMEFTSMLIERYVLSDRLIDVVLAALISLLPAVALIAWHHGRPGRDQLARSEVVGIPLNLILSAALLTFLFGGEDLGAATQTVQSTDETGQTVSELVPKPSFVRRSMVYFLDPLSLSDENKWMSYAIPFLLTSHLEQDPFLAASTLYKGFANGMFWQVKRANSLDGLRINPRLKSNIAQQLGLDYFVSGYVGDAEGQLKLNLEVYSVQPARKVGEFEVVASDLFELVDAASPLVKEYLEVQSSGDMLPDEFPVSSLITDSREALHAYITGANALLFKNDRDVAIEHWQQATSIDPTMAKTHMELALVTLETGDREGAQSALREALKHQYKLTPRQQLQAKALSYSIAGELEKERALYSMWIDLHPLDTTPLIYLGFSYLYETSEFDKAYALFERVYELDPSQNWLLNRMADIDIVRGNFDAAVSLLEQVSEARPDEYPAFVQIGDIKLREGNLAEAQEYFERGALVAGDMVTPTLSLTDLALKRGEFEEVESLIQEAYEIARAERQEAAVLEAQILIERTRGRLSSALAMVPRLFDLRASYQEPADAIVSSKLVNIDLYTKVGRSEDGKAELDNLKANANGFLGQMLDIGYLAHYVIVGDTTTARIYLKSTIDFISQFQLDHLRYLGSMFEGLILLTEEDFEAAASVLARAVQELESSIEGAKRTPNYFDLQIWHAEALREAGSVAEARAILENVIGQWPANPRAQFSLARCALVQGDVTLAQDAAALATQVWEGADPSFQDAIDARAFLTQLGTR